MFTCSGLVGVRAVLAGPVVALVVLSMCWAVTAAGVMPDRPMVMFAGWPAPPLVVAESSWRLTTRTLTLPSGRWAARVCTWLLVELVDRMVLPGGNEVLRSFSVQEDSRGA